MISQISFVAIVAIGLVVFIGTSAAPAAFAFWAGQQGATTSQSIKQANFCFEAYCSNHATNTANTQGANTVQSINQVNACAEAVCKNSASNSVK